MFVVDTRLKEGPGRAVVKKNTNLISLSLLNFFPPFCISFKKILLFFSKKCERKKKIAMKRATDALNKARDDLSNALIDMTPPPPRCISMRDYYLQSEVEYNHIVAEQHDVMERIRRAKDDHQRSAMSQQRGCKQLTSMDSSSMSSAEMHCELLKRIGYRENKDVRQATEVKLQKLHTVFQFEKLRPFVNPYRNTISSDSKIRLVTKRLLQPLTHEQCAHIRNEHAVMDEIDELLGKEKNTIGSGEVVAVDGGGGALLGGSHWLRERENQLNEYDRRRVNANLALRSSSDVLNHRFTIIREKMTAIQLRAAAAELAKQEERARIAALVQQSKLRVQREFLESEEVAFRNRVAALQRTQFEETILFSHEKRTLVR